MKPYLLHLAVSLAAVAAFAQLSGCGGGDDNTTTSTETVTTESVQVADPVPLTVIVQPAPVVVHPPAVGAVTEEKGKGLAKGHDK